MTGDCSSVPKQFYFILVTLHYGTATKVMVASLLDVTAIYMLGENKDQNCDHEKTA